MCWPSGVTATAFTESVCPVKVWTCVPSTWYSRTAPATKCAPSGSAATQKTALPTKPSRRCTPPGEQLRGAVVRAADEARPARQRHPLTSRCVRLDGAHAVAAHLDGLVVRAGEEVAAIAAAAKHCAFDAATENGRAELHGELGAKCLGPRVERQPMTTARASAGKSVKSLVRAPGDHHLGQQARRRARWSPPAPTGQAPAAPLRRPADSWRATRGFVRVRAARANVALPPPRAAAPRDTGCTAPRSPSAVCGCARSASTHMSVRRTRRARRWRHGRSNRAAPLRVAVAIAAEGGHEIGRRLRRWADGHKRGEGRRPLRAVIPDAFAARRLPVRKTRDRSPPTRALAASMSASSRTVAGAPSDVTRSAGAARLSASISASFGRPARSQHERPSARCARGAARASLWSEAPIRRRAVAAREDVPRAAARRRAVQVDEDPAAGGARARGGGGADERRQRGTDGCAPPGSGERSVGAARVGGRRARGALSPPRGALVGASAALHPARRQCYARRARRRGAHRHFLAVPRHEARRAQMRLRAGARALPSTPLARHTVPLKASRRRGVFARAPRSDGAVASEDDAARPRAATAASAAARNCRPVRGDGRGRARRGIARGDRTVALRAHAAHMTRRGSLRSSWLRPSMPRPRRATRGAAAPRRRRAASARPGGARLHGAAATRSARRRRAGDRPFCRRSTSTKSQRRRADRRHALGRERGLERRVRVPYCMP